MSVNEARAKRIEKLQAQIEEEKEAEARERALEALLPKVGVARCEAIEALYERFGVEQIKRDANEKRRTEKLLAAIEAQQQTAMAEPASEPPQFDYTHSV